MMSLAQSLDQGDDSFFNFSSLFTAVKVLGQGSFGRVVQAIDNATGEELAIKVIQKKKMGEECIEKVKEEARILEKLNHPNVVCFKKVCETETRILIAMELVKGGSLADLVRSKRAAKQQLTEREVSVIMKSLFQAVGYIHGKNIIHRDLKPGTLLLISMRHMHINHEESLINPSATLQF